MLNKILLFAILISTTMGAIAQHDGYQAKEYIANYGDTLLYRALQPETIVENVKYPLVLFLHGAGERGSNNSSQLQHGSMQFTNPVNREAYPSFVLFPQCPEDKYWAPSTRPSKFDASQFPMNDSISNPLGMVEELLEQTVRDYPIDTNRIYIIGLSMGGMGTYDIVVRNPNMFAAAVAICGAVNPERLREMETDTQFRLYHGDADSVVPVDFSREAYKALKQTGKNVEYFEFPGVNHGSWDPAFNQPDFITWLYSQNKENKQD